MKKIKYLNEKQQLGIKCPYGEKLSKTTPITFYVGSQNCLECRRFCKIENGYVFCDENKKLKPKTKISKLEKIENNKQKIKNTYSGVVFLTDNY